MTAVDTNILVRIITNDDRRQAARAATFLRAQDRVLIAKTVILELEWVLRSTYRLLPPTISAALRRLVAMPNADFEDAESITRGLASYDRGVDFADSLHLASARAARQFATFDSALRRRARRLAIGNVVEP
jgi:predicted nucleic-acid-binding protein